MTTSVARAFINTEYPISVLVDTSVLSRTLQPHHVLYPLADGSIQSLIRAGHELRITPQNLFELWVVATRPTEQNGLGMTSAIAHNELARIKSMFVPLPDTAAIYQLWESLVFEYDVLGKSAHDTRLVAAMRVHSIKAVLTFDVRGFSRYKGVDVIHPAAVI